MLHPTKKKRKTLPHAGPARKSFAPRCARSEKLCPTVSPLKGRGPLRPTMRGGVDPPASPPGRARRPRYRRGPSAPQSVAEGPHPQKPKAPPSPAAKAPAGHQNAYAPPDPLKHRQPPAGRPPVPAHRPGPAPRVRSSILAASHSRQNCVPPRARTVDGSAKALL